MRIKPRGMSLPFRFLLMGVWLLALAPGQSFGETVLITGANSGIGLEFARQYAERGWQVIATHRRSAAPKTLTDLAALHDNVRLEQLDVTDVAQARALAQKLAEVPIDVLINNAGVYNDRSGCQADDDKCPGDWDVERFGKLKYALLDTIMAVNIKGPLIVSEAFYPNVLASRLKKIVAISSSNGSLTGEKLPGPNAIFYRMSKAALNREMQAVAAATAKDGVTVVILNPGPVLTEHQEYLASVKGMLKTSFTVGHMIQTIDKTGPARSGKFQRYDGAAEPW